MTSTSNAQEPKQPTKPGPELKRLEVFLGKWNMEGRQYDGPVGKAENITAVNTYEWLAGGYMVHHFDGHVGDSEAACIEIIGYDAASQSYPTHSYYNNGMTNEWQTREHGGIWTLTGEWPMAGKPTKVRCTTEFTDAGNTTTGKWEYLSDDSKWETFWDVKATKV